jgi:hypothetical protein
MGYAAILNPQAETFNTALPGSFPASIISQNLSTSSNVPFVRMG